MIKIFQGYYFQYAGKNSEDWDIVFSGIDDDGRVFDSGSKYEPVTGRVSSISEELFFGLKVSESLTGSVQLTTSDGGDIPYEQFLDIKDWLFGQKEPQKLVIYHPDLQDYYYPCLLLANEDLFYTGNANGLSVEVRCVTPFAYKLEDKLFNKTFAVLPTGASYQTIYNFQTAELEGHSPIVKIKMHGAGNVTIQNTTNHSALCFEGAPNGTITVDCQTQIITPVSYLSYIKFHDNVDSQFLKLNNGENNIQISGNVDEVEITGCPSRRLGCG